MEEILFLEKKCCPWDLFKKKKKVVAGWEAGIRLNVVLDRYGASATCCCEYELQLSKR